MMIYRVIEDGINLEILDNSSVTAGKVVINGVAEEKKRGRMGAGRAYWEIPQNQSQPNAKEKALFAGAVV